MQRVFGLATASSLRINDSWATAAITGLGLHFARHRDFAYYPIRLRRHSSASPDGTRRASPASSLNVEADFPASGLLTQRGRDCVLQHCITRRVRHAAPMLASNAQVSKHSGLQLLQHFAKLALKTGYDRLIRQLKCVLHVGNNLMRLMNQL